MTVAPPSPADSASARPPADAGTPRRARPSPAARRFGYLVAIALNVALLWVVHRWPGWQEASFLTDETTEVLPWVTAQLAVSIAVNALWLVTDPRWLRALGDLVGAVVGLVVALRILDVFPFAFDDGGVPWETWVRFALWVAVVGSAIGIVVHVVALVRALRAPAGPTPAP